MNLKKFFAFCSIAVVVAVLALPVVAQQGKRKLGDPYDESAVATRAKESGPLTDYGQPLPEVNAAASTNWALHNLDLSGSRYSPLDQINTSNCKTLAPRWLAQTGVIVGRGFQGTPIVVDGVMYVTDTQANAYALNAVTGERIWKFNIGNQIGGGEAGVVNRGAVYGDGAIYVGAAGSLFAIDAKTGDPLAGFGDKGKADVVLNAIKTKYPQVKDPIELGYAITHAPQYYKGVVYVGVAGSERHIPGGLLLAVNAKTGNVLWKFNTVPQGPEDVGWDLAGPTWTGGVRNGGGVWETPAIDPDLGTIYVVGSNPSPDIDGSGRKGINLFTNSVIALDLTTGKLKWAYQHLHHDIWDWDTVSPAILFDVQIGGRTVKAVANAQKNGFLYMLNRETGQPIFPIVEVPVPTATDVPGEQAWPTQPIPFKANGQPMEPFRALYPVNIPAQLAADVRPFLTPPQVGTFIVQMAYAANFAPSSISPRTGLLYVTAADALSHFRANPVGATLKPGQGSLNWVQGPAIRPAKGTLSAYDPTTGSLVWQSPLPAPEQGGSVATAGNLVFVGDANGFFHAFDARTGAELWSFYTGASIAASPIVYQVNGEEYVTIASGGTGITGSIPGDLIVTFALPPSR